MPGVTKANQTITIVLTAVVVGGGIIWWGVARLIDTTLESAGQWVTAGEEYGAETDDHGCLNRALALDSECSGTGCLVQTAIFLPSCLSTSEKTLAFCDGVPPKDAIIDSVNWQLQQCQLRDNTSSACPQLFGSVQSHCQDVD